MIKNKIVQCLQVWLGTIYLPCLGLSGPNPDGELELEALCYSGPVLPYKVSVSYHIVRGITLGAD